MGDNDYFWEQHSWITGKKLIKVFGTTVVVVTYGKPDTSQKGSPNE